MSKNTQDKQDTQVQETHYDAQEVRESLVEDQLVKYPDEMFQVDRYEGEPIDWDEEDAEEVIREAMQAQLTEQIGERERMCETYAKLMGHDKPMLPEGCHAIVIEDSEEIAEIEDGSLFSNEELLALGMLPGRVHFQDVDQIGKLDAALERMKAHGFVPDEKPAGIPLTPLEKRMGVDCLFYTRTSAGGGGKEVLRFIDLTIQTADPRKKARLLGLAR